MDAWKFGERAILIELTAEIHLTQQIAQLDEYLLLRFLIAKLISALVGFVIAFQVACLQKILQFLSQADLACLVFPVPFYKG